jgi:hypothetical protein
MYNAAIYCDQAVRADDLVHYCCAATRLPGSCLASAGCPSYLTAWNCRNEEDLPRAQELLASKSRADTYFMTCSIPTVNPDGTKKYCCYVASLIPEGGTCTQHVRLAGCAPGRFGFACYGPDTPMDDYPVMNCPEPGFAGLSMEGFPATLYCCDFVR